MKRLLPAAAALTATLALSAALVGDDPKLSEDEQAVHDCIADYVYGFYTN